MPQRKIFSFKSVLLIFLLISGIFWKLCDSQVNREEANKPPDGHGGDDGAFFALRSCHRLLHGVTGEFFSPDYLCSNPPLWCNWTIQVDPGKRVQLHLEDLTPDDICHLKQDQVHVDEPAGHFQGHKVLQKCWREAKYTSSSNTLYVVLLIGGWPSPPYRGFYGRYQAFGPPVVYNPQEGLAERHMKSQPSLGLVDSNEFGPVGEQMESDLPQHPAPENSDLIYDYYNQLSAKRAEPPWEPEDDTDTEVDENHRPVSENYTNIHPVTAESTVPTPTQGTSRSERGAVQSPSDSAVHPVSPQQQQDGQNHELKTPTSSPPAVRRNVEVEASPHPEEAAVTEEEILTEEEKPADGESRTEVSEASDLFPPPSEEPEPEEPEQTHPHPNMVEPLSDHRGNINIRNHSTESSHLPGDHLFEVAVEVNFSQDLEESWDRLAAALLLSVEALISERLEGLHAPLTMTAKRKKRLSVGALYILWLQIGQGPGGPQVREAVHDALQDLILADVAVRENRRRAVIASVSTTDVNECGSQLALCDVNADCVNHFGSYSCRCRPGFQDGSRLGSGGTVCVDLKDAGCSSGLSAETKGVYVLFFLLSSLILMLLAAAGMLYHRHHRGAFLVSSHSRGSICPPDPNNNSHHHHHHHHHDDSFSGPADSELPPPPPPARAFREGWLQVKERCPAVDLPLLRFSPLLPPDGYMEPQEGGKM